MNNAPNLTPAQIDLVLCDIATTAKQIDRLAVTLMQHLEFGQHEEEALLLAIECMAQRIGWSADMAMERSEFSSGPCFGGAEKWMMPPLFHFDQGEVAGHE